MFIELNRVFNDHTQKVMVNVNRIIHFSNDGVVMCDGVFIRVKEDAKEIINSIEYVKDQEIINVDLRNQV